MKAYIENWVENLKFKSKLESWFKSSLLNQEELDLGNNYFKEDFYKPNWFILIGLFIFTNIAILFTTTTFLAMVGIFDSEIGLSIALLIVSIGSFVGLEYFIKIRKLYRSGIDNALLYLALGFLYFSILIFFDFSISVYYFPLILFVICIPAFIRYSDPLISVTLFFSFFTFVFLFASSFPLGKTILPFLLMSFSILVYFISKRTLISLYYIDALQIIETLSFIVFYLAGNYLVVREANAILNNNSPSIEIPFGVLFWVFTFTIPFIYIFIGIQKKDRKAIIVGLLTFVFSIFTFRYYFSVLRLEWAFVLGGLFLISFSLLALKYLKISRFNLSIEYFEATKFSKLESILAAQAFQSNTSSDDNLKMGGGDFGGSGSEQSY